MMSPPTKSEARRQTGRRAKTNQIEPEVYAHATCAQVEARASGYQTVVAGAEAKEEQILFGFANEISLSPKKCLGCRNTPALQQNHRKTQH